MIGIFSPYRDHLLVQVDRDAAHRTAGGLHLPDWQRGDRDPTSGIVLAVPQGLSRAGLPYPDMDGGRYAYADLAELPAVGDTVHFKYNSLRPEREHPERPGVYLLGLDSVVAVQGAGGLRPFQGLLLGEPVWGDDVRELPDGSRVQVGPTGLVTEADPLPLPFLMRVLHAGQPLRGQPDVVAVGDTVSVHRMIYAHHAVKQKDDEEASARWCRQPPCIVVEGRELIYVPRQLVLGKATVQNNA